MRTIMDISRNQIQNVVLCLFLLFLLHPRESLSQEKIDSAYVEHLLNRAGNFINSNSDSLFFYVQQGKVAAELIRYTRGIMGAIQLKGSYHWLKMEFDSAMEAYEQALVYCIQLEDLRAMNELYRSMGMVFSKLGDYPQAIEFLLNSAKGADSIGEIATLGKAYNSLAVAYLNMHNTQQAKYFLELGIKALIQQGDSINLAGAYSNFGNIHREEGNLDEAKKMYELALGIFTTKEIPRGVVTCLNNLSSIYVLEGSASIARDLLRKSLEISKKHGFSQNELIALIATAEAEFLLGNFDTSKVIYFEALKEVSESGYLQQFSRVYLGLGDLFYRMENHREASDYYKKYAHLRDSLANEELANSVTNTRIAYEIKKRKNETDLLAKNLEIAELRSRNTQIVAGSIVCSLLVLITFLIFYYKRRRQFLDQEIEQAKAGFEISQLRLENQQLKEIELRSELETRNRELSTYTLNLLQKNEILSEIKKELKGMSVSDVKAKSSISRILSSSSLSSYQDKEWELFKEYFDSAYGGFFDKLSYLNPELTPYDKRLAALTRLELTGDQIASIMGISTSSVKVSRHRLKKKLNVADSMALGPFLVELDSNQSLGLTDFTHILDLIARNLAGTTTVGEAYWTVARNCIQYLRLEDCVIYEINWPDRVLRQMAAYNFDGNNRIQGSCNFQLPLETGICGYVARTGESVMVGDTTLDPRYVVGEIKRYSELAVPVFMNGMVHGVIDTENSKKHYFLKNHAVAMEKIAVLLSGRIADLNGSARINYHYRLEADSVL